ncbi:endoglucanase E [Asticcacaulis biprosthecium C19]|uniref:Endoglucanase E n=1 Tax=Asticcacaulis biprosthecium C19 TaxID=715226 RepID=F4QNA5_9CAUL|nr:GDSL-type esterase/lipase family protein [Asticcacaulis biprosthecium]EGF90813.1 endoglucanase E [Asticcacaulis biprosthecium C19]
MKRFLPLLTPLFLLAATAHAEVQLPMKTGGRVMPQANATDGYVHQWPGTYFESRFKGTSVVVRLSDDANILNFYLDGKKVLTETKPGQGDIELGPLADREHTIRVEKVTESEWTPATFSGFFVPDQANVLPAPAPAARRIEFIGDSYTVGYGNTSTTVDCTTDTVWATTDNSRVFGTLTAKHFGADYRFSAISGKGIVRNYNGGEGLQLPLAYPFDVRVNGITLTRNADAWQPHVIVIGLGTNDFSTPLNPGEKWATREALHADYIATYTKFVHDLRARYPGAYVILTATDQMQGEYTTQVKKVMEGLQASGERHIAFLPLNSLTYTGCHYHPSLADSQTVRDLLVAWIEAHPEVWQGD